MPRSRDDFRGFELDWMAEDACGHVAIFSTAGYGEVPAAVLEDEQTSLIDEEENLLNQLPVIGTALPEGRGPGKCHIWVELARRGFYVYDWHPWEGPYERVVVPSQRITRSDLRAILDDRPFVSHRVSGCFGRASTFDFTGHSAFVS